MGSTQLAPWRAQGGITHPTIHTWRRRLECFVELAEVGDKPQAVGLSHRGHLSTGEDRLDAQLLLCHIQHQLVGAYGVLWVHGIKIPAGRVHVVRVSAVGRGSLGLGTYTKWGRNRWMRAQRAKPLVQEDVKSVTSTP